MRLLLSRGDVIAPCKSSDDEESLSIQRPESAAATTPRRKLHAILLKEDETAGKKDSVVRPKYRFMKTKDSAAAAEPAPSSTKPAPTRNNNKAFSASAAAQAASAPAAAVHNTRTPAPKKKPAVATSPTHALASKQSVSPRSSPGSGAGARAGLQSPENDGRGSRAVASSNADKLPHPRLIAMAEDCSSPRFVRRSNLGAAKSKSGELGLAKNKSGELGLSLQRVPTRSGELGLTRPMEGGRNKSGEIVVSKPPSARNVAQQSSSSASPRSPAKVEKTKQQQQQQPPSPARVEEECRPQPAPASPPPPPVATAPLTAAAPKGRRVVEAINLQDLEAGRVTDFDAASYDFAPGQAVHPEGKQQQFWLTPASDTDDDESSSEVFDPFCIPTTSACGAAAAGGVGGGGVPATTPTKPHKANDPNWEAVRTTRSRDGVVGLSHFRLLKRLGCGDIGSVYLAELRATSCYFAMKVMDKGSLDNRKKQERAQTERQILELLDHPFLPTLYAHFDTPQFTCLVMEFCPGGDLHSLRQSQPGKCFTNNAARFYAAEVLLALEYLHMMGVVYRDLKPENVLVRKDGHIMLSDFDLSLKCDVSPTLLPTPSSSSSLTNACMSPLKRHSFSATYNHHVRNLASCIMPVCRIPTCTTLLQPPCVSGLPPNSSRPHLARRNSVSSTSSASSSIQASLYSLSGSFRRKHLRRESFNSQVVPLPELVAEPTEARSMSFVGTHEYLAPEIISGDGHGSAVDWWTFGIFLFELLYGKTPFRGSDNQSTLRNVLTQSLRFPDQAPRFDQEEDEEGVSEEAQSLVRGLLTKDPQRRLGSARGAAEIKAHPFFECVNWALIRCATPPEVPKAFRPPESVKTVGGRTPPPSPVADWDAALGPDSDVDFGDLF